MKHLLSLLSLILILSLGQDLFAQNIAINETGNNPDTSAMLDVSSTNKGFLVPRMTTTQQNAIILPAKGLVIFNTTENAMKVNTGTTLSPIWVSVSAVNWNITGNAGINPATQFLGTTDDKQMILKSNNQSYLEFGRRQTLGLTQSYPDYTDNDEKLTYVRSALQFEAPGASFYKPKMYIDANGNFRVKGSSAGTDYFEFGSTGSSNSGGFDFIIGDDGDEPIIFKSLNYNGGPGGTPLVSEIMRLQSGRMAVGSDSFSTSNPEKLLIDAGVTTSTNLMTGKGSIDNFLQINVQNRSAGVNASSDLVATNNIGTDTSNYVDLGINSSAFNYAGIPPINGLNRGYVYGAGNDFAVGSVGNNKSLIFFTTPGVLSTATERMRINGAGNVGVATVSPTSTMDVAGSSGFNITTTASNITLDASHYTVVLTGGTPSITLPAASSCPRRIYIIVNNTGLGLARPISTYVPFGGGTTALTPISGSMTIQSNGTSWYRIQ